MNNIYDFYRLPPEEQRELIGTPIEDYECYLYFPVEVHPDNNYGHHVGLIGILTPLREGGFRVFALSPDDLDCDLDFEEGERPLEKTVKEILTKIHLENFPDYQGYMRFIQQKVCGGKLYD